MSYQVRLSSAASRQIKKLPPDIKAVIIAEIATLGENPRPPNVVKLEGDDNAYRVRVRDYRIIYEIYDDELIIVIIKVGHRRYVYR